VIRLEIVAKPIGVTSLFDKYGIPRPYDFNFENEKGKNISVRVDKVIDRHMEKLAGNDMIIFTCQTFGVDRVKEYVIKYELNTCKWMLFNV